MTLQRAQEDLEGGELRDLRTDRLYVRADMLCRLPGFDYRSTNVYHKLPMVLVVLRCGLSHSGRRCKGKDEVNNKTRVAMSPQPPTDSELGSVPFTVTKMLGLLNAHCRPSWHCTG